MQSIAAVLQVPLVQMVLLLDLAPAVLVALQFPSDKPAWLKLYRWISTDIFNVEIKIDLVNPVEPILSSGQYVCDNSHSLFAVAKLVDIVLQVEWARLVGGEASQITLKSHSVLLQSFLRFLYKQPNMNILGPATKISGFSPWSRRSWRFAVTNQMF